MSLRPEVIGPVPEETARVARAAFPGGNRYLRLRSLLERLRVHHGLTAGVHPGYRHLR